ncbi:hypothetical protein [Nonomuraea sp. NPDC049695]
MNTAIGSRPAAAARAIRPGSDVDRLFMTMLAIVRQADEALGGVRPVV